MGVDVSAVVARSESDPRIKSEGRRSSKQVGGQARARLLDRLASLATTAFRGATALYLFDATRVPELEARRNFRGEGHFAHFS
jgi:hypothetical protein